MKRELMRYETAESEGLFVKPKDSLETERILAREQIHGQTTEANDLLRDVRALLDSAAPPSFSTAAPQVVLGVLAGTCTDEPADDAIPARSAISAPGKTGRSEPDGSQAGETRNADTTDARTSADTIPSGTSTMNVQTAARLLNVGLDAPWAAVEQARMQLVMLSHPSGRTDMSMEQENQILSQARQVNAAYLALSRYRATR